MRSANSIQRILHSLLILIIFILVLLMVRPWRAQGQGANTVTTVSAASYAPATAPESIAAAFGTRLATRTELASAQPLPRLLAGTTVRVNGEPAPLFFVSSNQINFLIPAGTPAGSASIVITSGDGTVSQGTAQIATVAPALFTANSNGSGPLASQILRRKASGQFIFEQLAQYSESEKRFITKAFDFGDPSDQLFLVLYLTGLRQVAPSNVRVNIGGVEYVPSGIAPVQGFTGLDQINVPLPRNFGGRGSIKLLVKSAGANSSNEGEFEIGSAASSSALQITRVPSTPVLVGEVIEIGGNGFAANPRENTVLIIADDGVTTKAEVLGVAGDSLRVRVPFGAGAGQLRVSRGQSEASAQIQVRTSVSGFVQEFRDGARVAVVGLPIALREPSGQRVETTTDSNGSFVLRGAVASPLSIIDLAGQAANGVNYPAQTRKMQVRANRDNQYKGDGDLANIIEIKRNSGTVSNLLTENSPVNETLTSNEPEDTIRSGQVVFDTNNSTITFPGGGSGQLGLTVLDPGRSPSNLPVGHFSSTIAQITPFGAKLNPGGKLTFPNSDGIPAGTKARLFKFDQTIGQETVGQFIDIGEATVSADGQRIETAPNAITETSYYFVSIPRPLAAINGRVLESDGRPAPRAVVNVRGQSAFTDGFGGFVLRNVPVLKSSGDRIKVEVGYQRPDGTISRKESAEVEISANQLATIKPEIVLDPQAKNFPPVILAPASLTVTAGETRDFDFSVSDPDGNQQPQVSKSGNADSFTTLISQGNGLYRLRLTPAANAAGSYTANLSALDNSGERSDQSIAVTVNQIDNSRPVAHSQSFTTTEDTNREFALTGSDPGGRTLSYDIVTQPSRGRLSGTKPNLTYTPDPDFNGTDSFTFKVSNGGAESRIATVFFAVSPVNDAPVLNEPGEQIVNAGETFNLVITATDPDGEQTLKFTQTGLPPGATFTEVSSRSRLLSWTPTITQTGSYTVQITVTDNGAPQRSNTKSLRLSSIAKWAKTSGPEGGKIYSFLSLGADLFAGTFGGGVFRSTDNGQSWIELNNGLTETEIHTLIANGQTILAGARHAGVFRSTDRGATWKPSNRGMEREFVVSLASGRNAIFAGTDGNGLFRSTDGGNSWQPANQGLPKEAFVTALAVIDDSVFAGCKFPGGVFRSGNNGESWTLVNTGLPTQASILALARDGSRLYAGVQRTDEGIGGVFFTTNNGNSWTPINTGLPNPTFLTVHSLAVSGNLLIAGTENEGAYRSTNQGQRWEPINTGLATSPIVRAVSLHGGLVFAGTFGGGVLRMPNTGTNLTAANSGLVSPFVLSFAVTGNDLFAGARGGGVFRSSDQGASWIAVNQGLTNLDVLELLVVDHQLFAGTEDYVFRSTDRGANWTQLEQGLTHNRIRALVAHKGSIFAGTENGGVCRLAENSNIWTPVNNKLTSSEVYTLAANSQFLFAGTLGGGVFRSADQGANWEQVNNGLPKLEVSALEVLGDKLFASTSAGIFRSGNQGSSWTSANFNLFTQDLKASGNNLFAATDGDGVYLTVNQGESWMEVNTGIPNKFTETLAINETGVMVGFPGGVARLSNSSQSWSEVNRGLGASLINAIVANGAELFAGTLGSGIFRSANQGQSWSGSSNGLPQNSNIQSIVTDGSILWAAAFGDGVYRLSNQGASWTQANTGLSNRFVNELFLNGSTLYAGTDGGVFRSLNAGNSWAAINTNLSNLRVVSFTSNAGVIYVGTDGGGVFRLNPDGVSWTRISTGLTSLSVTALGVSNGVLYAGTSGGGVCISRDGGENWTAVNNALPADLNVYAFAVSGKKVYAGSIYGVFVTENDGQNWQQINAGLLNVFVTGLAVSGDQLFASTASGGVFVSSVP